MEKLLTYCLDAYTRKELALSTKAKNSIFDYVKEAEKVYGSCKEICVSGKWPMPFPNHDSATTYPTWRIEVIFEKKTSIIHVNIKAIF
jgi:hypothetical protein